MPNPTKYQPSKTKIRHQPSRSRLGDRYLKHKRPILPYVVLGIAFSTINLLLAQIVHPNDLRSNLSTAYLVQVIVYAGMILHRHSFSALRLLQPSTLALVYIGLSITGGAFILESGRAASNDQYNMYYSWTNIDDVYSVISGCLLSLYILGLLGNHIPRSAVITQKNPLLSTSRATVALMILYTILALTAPIENSIFAQVKTIVFAAIIFVAFQHSRMIRWLAITGALLIVAVFSVNDKREAVFGVAPVLFMAFALRPDTKLTLPATLLGSGVAGVVIIVILSMSILRGYGGFDAGGFVEAIFYIPDYLAHERALGFIGNNFEMTYTLLHSHNAVSNAIHDPTLLQNGATYLRVFFLGWIGDAMGYKPDSILQSYTGSLFPEFRSIGGSWTVTSIGEAAWNFGLAAPAAIFAIYLIFDKWFFVSVRLVRQGKAWLAIVALSLVQFGMYYTRGSGIDFLFIFAIMSITFSVLLCSLLVIIGALPKADPQRSYWR